MQTLDQPDPFSLATVMIEPAYNNTPLDVTGTGFVIRTHSCPMLVTAGHNLSGRHPNGRVLHSKGGLPNSVTLTNFFGILAAGIPLFHGANDPNTDRPKFLSGPKAHVDVALLPLPALAGQHLANSLDDSFWRPNTYRSGISILHVADLCHIIGYPEGMSNRIAPNRVLPLWKTGHLANDPEFDFTDLERGFQQEPLSLVDATTRPGMSGAPVFVINNSGLTDQWHQAAAQARADLMTGGALPRRTMPPGVPFIRRSRLVGIYSGRTSDSSDIGLVWKPTVIHDLLALGTANW